MAETQNYGFNKPISSEPVFPNAIDNLGIGFDEIDAKIYELDQQNIKKSTYTEAGQIMYSTGAGVVTVLDKGTDGQILKSNETGVPVWGDLPVPPEIPEQMVLTGEELPVASIDYRGKLFLLEGGTGVSDVLHICIKNDADIYLWKELSFAEEV